MIQIKTTPLRNLDKICAEHYSSLEPIIMTKLARLSARQSDFINHNLRRIITSKPAELVSINKEFERYCTAPGRGKIKHINRNLSLVFDYSVFTRKDANYYCGYDLANKLNMKTCPYCNRSYTVTIGNGKNRIVRPDFDHFFPQRQYPLLSLSFYNLVPSCSTCNRTIKNQQKIIYGKYIHPYDEGFNEALKINFFPKDVESAFGIKHNYEILTILNSIQHEKAIRCQNSFTLFKLKEIYEASHNSEIADIIRKHCVSSGKYLEELKKAFPSIATIEELYRLAFGSYYLEEDFEKRPLAKLTKDIVEQLAFTYPRMHK